MHDIPTRIIVFNVVQLVACLYAAARGGAPERWTSAFMAIAAASTAGLAYSSTFPMRSVNVPILAVDVLLLAGVVGLALIANRFWLMWVAACQLVGLGFHLVRQLDPTLLDQTYNRFLGKLAYPMIILLVIGTARHAARRKRYGDLDWSPVRW